MRSIIPRDPFFREVSDIRHEFDQMLNRFLHWPSQEERTLTEGFIPAIETSIDKEGKKFQCEVMLPGVDPKDVNIQVSGNMLTISGERSSTRETKEANYLHREVVYGSFQRQIELPDGVDKDKVTAEYRNGVLGITAPISAASLPRKIEVKTQPAAKGAGA
jgi:HSP20 family protein